MRYIKKFENYSNRGIKDETVNILNSEKMVSAIKSISNEMGLDFEEVNKSAHKILNEESKHFESMDLGVIDALIVTVSAVVTSLIVNRYDNISDRKKKMIEDIVKSKSTEESESIIKEEPKSQPDYKNLISSVERKVSSDRQLNKKIEDIISDRSQKFFDPLGEFDGL